MIAVSNAAGVLIALFRTPEQVTAWAERKGVILENVNVRPAPERARENEWVREDYRLSIRCRALRPGSPFPYDKETTP